MRAVEISQPGGPEVLRLTERPKPSPGAEDVLIEVAFAGVNRPDALQRQGVYKPPPDASDLPGLECAGRIVAVGESAGRWSVGDEVCALLPGGGYAEFATAPATHCLPIPDGMSLQAAACLPETFFTVWHNVFQRGALKSGETFLVHGGTSGIGTTAIQLAREFGARVFATAGTDAKASVCEDIGAERGINYRQEDFVEVIKRAGGADLILDMVGGDYIARNINALRPDGRLVQIAFLEGSKTSLNFAQIMLKRLTITGSTLRPQSAARKAAICQKLEEIVWPLLNNGRITPVIDQTFALHDAPQAHAAIENDHVGKIVLSTK